jgi:predicted aldo/keto reductase-like oxidoreductase
MQFPNIVPDPGIEKVEELQEIAAIINAGEPFSEADKAALDQLLEESGSTWCHRCDYCQPCPQGVLISGALLVECTFKRYNSEGGHWMTDAPIASARNCGECGECLPRCPYHLDIPRLLKENIAIYDAIVAKEAAAK